ADPSRVQRFHAATRPLAQLVDRPELDRGGRAGLRTRGDQPVLLPVVAERALVGVSRGASPGGHPGWAGGETISAPAADVRLDVDVCELVVDDRPRRARLLTRGSDAVLADVTHHQPAAVVRWTRRAP